MKLFDVQKGNLLCRELVLPRRRIHGISLAVEDGGRSCIINNNLLKLENR